jgi:hypothetical protein
MSVAGTYDCTIKTPMGDQKATFTVNPSDDGASFSGGISSDMMGSMDIPSGSVSGNTLSWQMKMTSPMPMDLDCEATVAGDELTGAIKAGAFGSMALTGTRQG